MEKAPPIVLEVKAGTPHQKGGAFYETEDHHCYCHRSAGAVPGHRGHGRQPGPRAGGRPHALPLLPGPGHPLLPQRHPHRQAKGRLRLYQKPLQQEGEVVDYSTKNFYYYLDECYFHPERDKEFSSETEKNLVRKAMELLWNKESIVINAITYQNQEIRQKLIDKMMPEILDRAVEVYREAKDVKSETAYLASVILGTLINYNAYIERLFRQTFRG